VVTAGCCWLACVGVALAIPGFSLSPQTVAGTSGTTQTELYSMQVGCHPGYDRLVIRSHSHTPRTTVKYVASIVGPSGNPVTLPGTAKLSAVLRPARGHTLGGTSLLPTTLNSPCPNIRKVKVAEDFEGVVSLGLGIQQQKPFRVFRLTSPDRIVIDVKS
jgi:hypothetical protein